MQRPAKLWLGGTLAERGHEMTRRAHGELSNDTHEAVRVEGPAALVAERGDAEALGLARLVHVAVAVRLAGLARSHHAAAATTTTTNAAAAAAAAELSATATASGRESRQHGQFLAACAAAAIAAAPAARATPSTAAALPRSEHHAGRHVLAHVQRHGRLG